MAGGSNGLPIFYSANISPISGMVMSQKIFISEKIFTPNLHSKAYKKPILFALFSRLFFCLFSLANTSILES
jgi:hypothetical protein